MKDNLWSAMGKYFSGEADEAERTSVEAWRETSDENQREFKAIQELWRQTGDISVFEQLDTDKAWRQVSSRMDALERQPVMHPVSGGNSVAYKKPLLRVAAAFVALAAVLIAVYYLFDPSPNTVTEITTGPGETYRLELEDGSVVALNENTQVIVSDSFGSTFREIFLKGEAFFEVKKDVERPFVVQTPIASVWVLGTSFDVKARETEDEVSVTVETGRVQLVPAPSLHQVTDNNAQEMEIIPGERGFFSLKNKRLSKKVNPETNYLGWKTKKLVFENSRLDEVVKVLSDTYHKPVILQGEHQGKCRITAQFDKRSLDEILQVVTTTLGLSVSYQNNAYIITGMGCN